MIAPCPRCDHRPERGVGQPQHRGDQHVEEVLLLLDGVVEERLLQPEAGVVDQQVDRARRVGQPGLDRGQLGPVRRGRRRSPRPSTPYARAQLGGELLEPLLGRGRPAPGRARDAASWWAKARPMPAVGPVTRATGRADMRAQHSRSSASATGNRPRGMMGRVRHEDPILAVANQKGGVAKTTTVASLGRRARRARPAACCWSTSTRRPA